MPDYVDEIKSRTDIVDLVSQYVQLKKAGVNYKGLCPFHSEKTPSFVVSSEKQICHCFGCSKGGDIFTFVQEVEGVNFVEAIEFLADRAGIKIDKKKLKDRLPRDEKGEYFLAHKLACEFFENELFSSVEGRKVLDYLDRRGVNEETIREFRLGFAPDKYDALYPCILKKGISKNVLLSSGLVASKGLGIDDVYDKYRSRLIFPIFDFLGRICGFGGRALKKDQSPKYLNSPDNPIYNKSKLLYGLSHAKQFVKESDSVILVEGYFDMILPYQHGIKNLAATCGTALTADQARLVKRLTTNVVTCFDSDEAGFEATRRAYFLLQNFGITVKSVNALGEKDPADFVREHKDDFKKIIQEADDYLNYLVDHLLKKHNLKTVEGRKSIFAEILPVLKVMSPSIKDLFVRNLASKFDLKEKFLYEELENYTLPTGHPSKYVENESPSNDSNKKFSVQEIVLALVLHIPGLFQCLGSVLIENDFEMEMKSVYKLLTDQYNCAGKNFKIWDFSAFADLKARIDVLRIFAEDHYANFSQTALQEELKRLVERMKKERVSRKLQYLQKEIVEIERQGNKEKLHELLVQQQKLLQE